jgi:hypothetical protein
MNDTPEPHTTHGYTPGGRLNLAMVRTDMGLGGSFQLSPGASHLSNPIGDFLEQETIHMNYLAKQLPSRAR